MTRRTTPNPPPRHPAWHGARVAWPRDTMTHDGAQRLAQTIREAWLAIGYDIRPSVECVRVRDGACFAVRVPQLHNGLAPETARIVP